MKTRITRFIEERVRFAKRFYSFLLFCLEFHHQDIHHRIDELEKKIDKTLNHLKSNATYLD